MEIHELNTFNGTPGANDYFATDNGEDTSKISADALMAPLNERIDNIIAGPASSAQEVIDARLGADGFTFGSLGEAIRTQFENVDNNFNYVSERVILGETPAADGFEKATTFKSLTKQWINGSGVISDISTISLTELIPVNKVTDAVHTTLDLSIYKMAIVFYKNGAWVRNTGWYRVQPTNDLILLKDFSYDFDAIRIQYGRAAEQTLTSPEDNMFINCVTVYQGTDSFFADFNTVKSDSIKYVAAVSQIAQESNNLLANINDNVVFNATSAYFNDTPTGAGGSFINIRYTSGYNEQFFIESATGNRYERVVSRAGSIYRDWTLNGKTRFIKKKVYCTGDSIMWGRTSESGRASLTIPNNIASRYPVEVTNSAVGGDCITHRVDGASVYDRITQVDLSSYDYVVINGGTNDYGFGSVLGTLESADINTFYGAYKAIINYIISQNPYMRIMLITPTFRNYVAEGGAWHYGDAYTMEGDGGYTLNDICNAIIEIGRMYGLPVFDSRDNSPINIRNYQTTLELTSGSTDRYLHPSDDAYKLYGDSIASFFGNVF